MSLFLDVHFGNRMSFFFLREREKESEESRGRGESRGGTNGGDSLQRFRGFGVRVAPQRVHKIFWG